MGRGLWTRPLLSCGLGPGDTPSVGWGLGDMPSLVGVCGHAPLLSCGLGPVDLCLPSCRPNLSSLFLHLPYAAGITCLLTCLGKTSSHMVHNTGATLSIPASTMHLRWPAWQAGVCTDCSFLLSKKTQPDIFHPMRNTTPWRKEASFGKVGHGMATPLPEDTGGGVNSQNIHFCPEFLPTPPSLTLPCL